MVNLVKAYFQSLPTRDLYQNLASALSLTIRIRIWLQPYRTALERSRLQPLRLATGACPAPEGVVERLRTARLKASLDTNRSFFRQQPLLPTPIRLRILTAESQLLHIAPIRQHGPDLLTPPAARLKNNMPSIRRP